VAYYAAQYILYPHNMLYIYYTHIVWYACYTHNMPQNKLSPHYMDNMLHPHNILHPHNASKYGIHNYMAHDMDNTTAPI